MILSKCVTVFLCSDFVVVSYNTRNEAAAGQTTNSAVFCFRNLRNVSLTRTRYQPPYLRVFLVLPNRFQQRRPLSSALPGAERLIFSFEIVRAVPVTPRLWYFIIWSAFFVSLSKQPATVSAVCMELPQFSLSGPKLIFDGYTVVCCLFFLEYYRAKRQTYSSYVTSVRRQGAGGRSVACATTVVHQNVQRQSLADTDHLSQNIIYTERPVKP